MIALTPPFMEQAELTCGCITTGITPCALHYRADLLRQCVRHLLERPNDAEVRTGAFELLRLTDASAR